MTQLNDISNNSVALLLLVALLISVAHRLINKYLIGWIKNKRKQSLAGLYIPLGINIVWVLFVLYAIYQLALINPIISIFLSAIIIVVAWNNIKDFVQGILFKLQEGNIIGQRIKIEGFSGEIVKMRNTKIDLQAESGEIVQYPYSKLTNQVIGISTSVKNFKYCTFNVPIPYVKEIEKARKQLFIHLLNTPWIVSNLTIKTEVIDQGPENKSIKINAYTLDERFIPKIQQVLDSIKFEA